MWDSGTNTGELVPRAEESLTWTPLPMEISQELEVIKQRMESVQLSDLWRGYIRG